MRGDRRPVQSSLAPALRTMQAGVDHTGQRWTMWTEWGEDVAEHGTLGWDGPETAGDVVLVRRRPAVRWPILRRKESGM